MAEKYKVIVDKLELELKRMRAEGKIRLPSESDLCKTYSCSRQTIRAALDVLFQKGLIEKRRGSGSFIAGGTFTNRTVFFMTEDCDRYKSPALITGLKEQLSSYKYELKSISTLGSIKAGKDILLQVSKVLHFQYEVYLFCHSFLLPDCLWHHKQFYRTLNTCIVVEIKVWCTYFFAIG